MAKLCLVSPAEERSRHLTIFALAAPGAAIVWLVFHSVYQNLSESEKAIGYVDPLTQTGIYLGYFVMFGGTLVLAAIALWSGFQYLRLSFRQRR
jgi:hypothetical protein